jgi:hypothetical protein
MQRAATLHPPGSRRDTANFYRTKTPDLYQLFLISVSTANPPLGSRVALTATRGET